jgi:nucleotide-binding universal stress UspA family protein
MPYFKRILFPVDFSERCRGAAHYAIALAGRFGSDLILFHVVEAPIARPGELDFGAMAFETDLEGRVEYCRQLLDSFLEQAQPGESAARYVNIEKRLEQGDAARAIIRLAGEAGVDLIMMPTHGYGAFRRFILGSVTAKVLHDADCPVWTGVHLESAPPLEAIAFHRILCAVDLSDANERPLQAASELCGEYGAELIVVHAVPGSEAIPERGIDKELQSHLKIDARERIQRCLATLDIVAAKICIESGEVAHVVKAAAGSHQADLVVIGRSAHTGLAGRLRTHSYAIIRESPCPVLSI